MGTKELIAELEKTRHLFEWSLSPEVGPRIERRAVPRLRVRGKLRDDPNRVLFDPVGAICFARTGRMFSEDYWTDAAALIALPMEDARDLVAAANDMTWRITGDYREPDPYKKALRKALLQATGLQSAPIPVEKRVR